MPATSITRRRVLAAAAGLVVASQIPAAHDSEARPGFLRQGKGIAPPPASDITSSFVNLAGSASPANYPLLEGKWFAPAIGAAPAEVPAGYIAVPQVGGADLVYQFDERVYWSEDDSGPFKGGALSIAGTGAISAGAAKQIDWVIRPGSYTNSSAITLDDVKAETDIILEFSNFHSAIPAFVADDQVGHLAITIGGGQVTGGKVRYWYAPTMGSSVVRNINQVGASGGQLRYYEDGTVEVIAPGSGYSNLNGGNFSVSVNDIIDAVAADGNRTNGKRIEQYKKGSVVDAWFFDVWVFDHFSVRIYVERWKKADGSLLDYAIVPAYGNGMVITGLDTLNYTFDVTLKNGATAVAGAGAGDDRYESVILFVSSSAFIHTEEGQAYWLNNTAAFNSIQQEYTPDECLHLRHTGIVTPWLDNIVPTLTAPTVEGSFEYGSAKPGATRVLVYSPGASGGIMSRLGNAGGNNQLAPMTEVDALRFMSLIHGNKANARKYMRNIRVGAAHSAGLGQQGAMFREPTTMYPPNIVPSSVQSFSGMTPTRESIWAHTSFFPSLLSRGYPSPTMWGYQTFQSAMNNTYHSVCVAYGAYIIEARRWQLDVLQFAATNMLFGKGTGTRYSILGSTHYVGSHNRTGTNVRDQAWPIRGMAAAAAVTSRTWANGDTQLERSYIHYAGRQQYEYLNALRGYTGTMQWGLSGTPFTKTATTTNSGVYPEYAIEGQGDLSVPFMELYDFETAAFATLILKGSLFGDVAAIRLDELGHRWVNVWGASTPLYQANAFRVSCMQGLPPSDPADFSTGYTTTDPVTKGAYPRPLTGGGTPSFIHTAGSDVVTLNGGGVRSRAGVAMGDGSRVKFTTSDTSGTILGIGEIPGLADPDAWLYWKQDAGNPASGKLYSDAAFTSSVTFLNSNAVGVTISAAGADGDEHRVIFTSSGLAGSPITVTHAKTAGQTTTTVRQALQAAINAHSTLSAAGITASRNVFVDTDNQMRIKFPNGLDHTIIMVSQSGTAALSAAVMQNAYFWMVLSNPPANNSGFGTDDDASGLEWGRLHETLGALRLATAAGIQSYGGRRETAPANILTILNSLSGIKYALGPLYAFSATR